MTYAFVGLVLAYIILVLEPWQAQALVPLLFIYGSLPFPLIFVRLFRGKAIAQEGSGNISLSNSFRVGGSAAGVLTLVGEASKGFLPALISWYFFGYDIEVAVGLLAACMLGAFYSPFLKGKGGLGTTLAMWGLLFLSPISLLVLIGIMILLLLLLKDSYLATLATFWAAPIVVCLISGSWPIVLVTLLYAIIYSLRYSRKRDEIAHGIRIAKK